MARLRAIAYLLMAAAGFIFPWAGIKHAAKVPVVSTGVLVLLFLLPVALFALVEYLGHLEGRYVRDILREKDRG